MSDATKIQWTDSTWNPVRGCTKVSAGCKNCYAERFAERFRGVKGHPFEQGFDVRLVPEALDLPLRWKKPRRVFVNSMSDLFHPDVPDDFICDVFEVMAAAGRHTFQILTKRPERLETALAMVPHNVWLGVSVEDQRAADERVGPLVAALGVHKFLSCEPLLGPVTLDLAGIGWVIVGGESGPGARPMDLAWAGAIVAQCKAARVPVFVKQLGAHPSPRRMPRPDFGPEAYTLETLRICDRKGADMAEWPEDLRVREWPEVP